MKIRTRVLWTALLVLVVAPAMVSAQQSFSLAAYDIKLGILPEKAFEAQFGKNPDIPRTDYDILALARKLYPPVWQKDIVSTEFKGDAGEECHEYELGLLFAALRNPAVSNATRDAVDQMIIEAVPPLPRTYTYGHFKFYYTDSDPDPNNNVTLNEIKWTATQLQAGWNRYVAGGFKEPKYYLSGTQKMIKVKVYYLGASLLGQTSSGWNHIELNSKYCVKNYCKRRTTSNHELFHRVQYSYGYVSGTANLKWIVEGTAAWSQKFNYESIRDYMGRMNSGLLVPDKKLITDPSARSYDACHYWVYLQKRSGTHLAIRDIWATFQTNGKNAKAAVNTVVYSRLGKMTFDGYTQAWHKANYLKDLLNGGTYEYTEDEATTTSCGNVYGPLSHVPKTSRTILSNATIILLSGTVSAYGADYYDFTVNPAVTAVKIVMNGSDTGNFSYHFAGVKNNRWVIIYNTSTTDYTFSKTITPGKWDKLWLIVTGRDKGGSYSLRVGP